MLSAGYMKLIFVFLITFLTLTAARRHGKKSQYDDSFESGEYDIEQLPGNGHKIGRSHRGRGRYHKLHRELRGNGGFNEGIQDGYPIRGPVQQPFIPTPSIDRSPAPYTNLQQTPVNSFQYPANNMQQSAIKFPLYPEESPNSLQGVQNNLQEIATNYQKEPVPSNIFQQQPANNFQLSANSIQQPSIRFQQHQGPPAQIQNNLQDIANNYQKSPVPPNPINNHLIERPQVSDNPFLFQNGFSQQRPVPPNSFQYQSGSNPSNNGPLQQPQASVNPFLPQYDFNHQSQIQTPTQTQSSPVKPSTFANKQNPHALQPVTNELPTTVQPSDTTPSYVNPRRTDLLYGSNILEEDQRLNSNSTEIPLISFEDRGIFDSAPHCQNGYILVNNKCRLKV